MKGRNRQGGRACADDTGCLHSGTVCQSGESAGAQKSTGPEIWEDTDGQVDILWLASEPAVPLPVSENI